jgi:pantoate kinase
MGRRTPAGATRIARAFAPGHVTGFFTPSLGARDPRGRGSIGAGLVLDLGVTAEARWSPGGRTSISVRSPDLAPLPISEEVARRLGAALGGRLEVRLSHQLPIGQGFGSSAAGALATGLAVARVADLPRAHAIEVAHLAELFGGGGLGGVASILGGGLEQRTAPGIPPFGRIVHRPVRGDLFIGALGRAIPSPELLSDPRTLGRIRRAADEAVPRRLRAPTLGEFLDGSERFTDALQLGGPSLQRTIHELRGTGARVAQAMFGRSFFAVAPTPRDRGSLIRVLERRGLRSLEIPIAGSGARTLGTVGLDRG